MNSSCVTMVSVGITRFELIFDVVGEQISPFMSIRMGGDHGKSLWCIGKGRLRALVSTNG